MTPPLRLAPERLIVLAPGEAVIVPEPHVPERPFGLATTKPAGSVSVNEMPVWFAPLGIAMLNVKAVDPPAGIGELVKDLVICGGATTTRVADAVKPGPALVDVTVLVVFISAPLLRQ